MRMLSLCMSFGMFGQCKHQFLTCTLSAHICSLRISSACFERTFPNLKVLLLCREYVLETNVYGQGTHQFLMRILSLWRVCSACLKGQRSVRAPVLDSCAPCTHHFLTCMLSVHISSWCACSVHSLVPYVHTEDIQNEHFKIWKTDVHAEHACMEQFIMIRVHISSWRSHAMHASVFGTLGYPGHVENTHFPIALFLITLMKHLNGKLFADATWFLVLFYQMS